MEVEPQANWELSFYSVTHIATNEFVVKPLTPKSKANAAASVSPLPSTTALSPTGESKPGHGTNGGSFGSSRNVHGPQHRTIAGHGHGTPTKARGHHEKESIHGVRLEPLQSGLQLSPPQPHLQHKSPPDRTPQQPLAEWELPRKHDDHRKLNPLLEDNIPRHMQHWATIDHGDGLYDFMSPSRMMGKPMLSPREPAHKSFVRGRSSASRPPEHSYKSRGQSVSLPDLSRSHRMDSHQNSYRDSPEKMENKSPMISPMKGRLRPSYVKINYADIPLVQETMQQMAMKKKKKPLPPLTSEDEALKKLIKEQFIKYDLNGDAFISRKEAAMLLEQNVIEQGGDIKVALDFILSKMDFDMDQKINYEEYERCVLKEPLLRGCFGFSGISNQIQ